MTWRVCPAIFDRVMEGRRKNRLDIIRNLFTSKLHKVAEKRPSIPKNIFENFFF